MTLFQTDEVRLVENDVQTEGDGGRVVLVAQSKPLLKATGVQLLTLVMNFNDDEPMKQWPYLKQERVDRRFRVTIEEITG